MSTISFSGLASGIDTKSLIASILDQQRTAQVDPIKTQVSALTETNDSFSKLKDLLNAVKSAAGVFRTIQGGGIDKSSTSSNELVANATASKVATVGSTEISVTQLASSSTASFADRFSSGDAVINSSISGSASQVDRTVTVNVGQGSTAEAVAVTLDGSTTAQGFVTDFNSKSTKAQASLVNVGTSSAPSYAIVIASKNTGVDEGSISISTGAEVGSAGSGSLRSSAATISAAKNSLFSVSGISGTVERSGNDISDVISGVTLHLSQTGTATISVTPDKESSTNAVSNLVKSYNDVISYLAEQNQITRDTSSGEPTNIFSPLSNTRIDENAVAALRSSFSAASLSGGLVNTFSDLGITTERDGTLKFDEDVFSKAVDTDSTSVNAILTNFGESAASVDGTIAQYTRFGGLIDQAVQQGSTSINNGNNRIHDIESGLEKQQESLTAQFARLESLVSQLNQQGQVLTSLLPK